MNTYEKKNKPLFIIHRAADYGQNELYHHGIKGQKWGVRRFQNKDGSLTAKGRVRYQDDNDSGSSSTPSKDAKKYFNANGSLNNKGKAKLIDKKRGFGLSLTKEARKMLGYGDDIVDVQIISDGTRYLKEKDYPDPDYGYRVVPNLTKEQRQKHTDEFKRRSKLSAEESDNELRKIVENSEGTGQKKYLELFDEIKNFSGDRYEQNYVSDSNKASLKKMSRLRDQEDSLKQKRDRAAETITKKKSYDRNVWDERKLKNNAEYQKLSKAYDAAKQERNKAESDHLGVVLKDLGYKDTPTARELIESTVYWD